MTRVPSPIVLALMFLLLAGTADAALTTNKCLLSKRQAWGNLRKCEAAEQGKTLKGKPADLAKCQTKFQAKHAKITAQAADDGIACRYGANADGTVTDYDTGLQWEKKDGEVGGQCPLIVGSVLHCVNTVYLWDQAQAYVSPASSDSVTVPSFRAGTADWRLPTIVELLTIADATVPGCSTGSPCIDPIFGSTNTFEYWSATSNSGHPDEAWSVNFGNSFGHIRSKGNAAHVRAVRAGL